MFQFTQLRPTLGVDIVKARNKHIPVYSTSVTNQSELFQRLNETGISSEGIEICLNHISNNLKFTKRKNEYLHFSKADLSKDMEFANLKYLAFILQKTRHNRSGIAEDKIQEYLKSVSVEKLEAELSKINDRFRLDISDDLLSLLLLSSYFPEYRRFIESLRRLLFMLGKYDVKEIINTLLPIKIVESTKESHIEKIFYRSRILLPFLPKKENKANSVFNIKYPNLNKDHVKDASIGFLGQKSNNRKCDHSNNVITKNEKS